jgi:chromosomal replication initiation ATPase DnaA
MIIKSDLEKLVDLCCKELEINIEDFYGKKRTRKHVDARRIFFYILNTYHKMSAHFISQRTNSFRNRVTIMYLNEYTEFYLKRDEKLKNLYKSIYENYTKTCYEQKK